MFIERKHYGTQNKIPCNAHYALQCDSSAEQLDS